MSNPKVEIVAAGQDAIGRRGTPYRNVAVGFRLQDLARQPHPLTHSPNVVLVVGVAVIDGRLYRRVRPCEPDRAGAVWQFQCPSDAGGPGRGSASLIYLAVIILGIGSWSFTPKLLSLPMELVVTQQKVAVVWGTMVTVSGTGMFLSPIVIGALRDATGTFVPGFLIFAVGAWFLFVAGIIYPKAASRNQS